MQSLSSITKNSFRALLFLGLIFALVIPAYTVNAATTNYVVTPASPDWGFLNDNGTSGDWTATFVNGPATPPLGSGSVNIQLNSAGAGIVFGTQKYQGVLLADITALSYSTYTNLSPAAMTFQINYDPDVTTVEASTWYGRLTYEPYMSGTVNNGAWQTWDMINGGAGKWWASPNGNSTVDNSCPQSAPCTWNDLITAFPNIGIRNDALSGIMFKAGSGWNGFNGNVDNFTFETAGNTDVYNFDLPSTIYVDDDWAGVTLGNDPDGAGPATKFGADSFAAIQDAIDAVAPNGTIQVYAGTYIGDLVIDRAVTLLGPNAFINPNTGSRVAEAVVHPSTSNPNPAVCTNMVYMETSNITIKGFNFDGDNPGLTSSVIINGADVDACEVLAGYEGMGNITVENNILQHATYAGIDFYNYTSAAATTNNYIRYNRFEDIGTSTYGYGLGILIYNNFYAAITDNVMTGVRVGIQTGNYYFANPGSTNSISNNQISAWRLGIFHNLWYSSATPLTISNNTITAENYTGAVNYSGILLSSMGTTVSATVTGNTLTVPGTDTHSGYTTGYNIWNVQNTAPITISGGTVTGGDYGVFVNNWEGYSSDANNTFITVNGVTILDSDTAGVYVKDSDSNGNGATVYADVQNSTIDTNATGILVYGPQATAKANLNNLSGNPTAGITNGNTSFTMDGTYNWWGSATGPGPVGPGTGVNVSTFVDFDPWCVNVTCTPPVHNVNQNTYYYTIQAAINAAANGDVIEVAAGTYDEDVNVNKTLTLTGADAVTTIIRGVFGGDSATVRISANNVTVEGFTITRLGNNTTDWNNAALNSMGIGIQGGYTGAVIQDNIITANRTGIDINNSSGHTVSNNNITNNRTGMLFRNTTNNMTVVDNQITNNWTMGILFLDASGGTNSPVQSALFSTFSGNNLTGNWYGQVVERQSGGSLPVPGTTNLKNFAGNWWGTMTPVVSTVNSSEPGYAAQIPVEFGGTAVAPGGQPDILGPASANIVYLPLCFDVVCTTPVHNVTQNTDYFTIQSAIDVANNGDVIAVAAGTYVENVNINKSVTLYGAGAGSTIIRPALSNPNCGGAGGGSLCAGSSNVLLVGANDVVIHDLTVDGDNPALTSGIVRSGADLDARNGIITNHALGTFNGLEIYNVTVQNIYLRGIYASSSGSFNIHNNTVTNVQGEANSIAMMNWMGTGVFAGNTVSNSNDGIVSNHSRGTQYLNNSVTSSGSGIHTDNNGSSGGVADLIQGNNVYNCAVNGYGVWVFAPYLNVSVDQNTVTNCAVGLTSAGGFGGIPTFTDNTVDGQDLAGSTGFYITTSLFGWGSADANLTATGNIIRNTDVGFELESEPTYLLTGNFEFNQIYGNTAGLHSTGTGTFLADFDKNWWGHISGPSGVGAGSGDSIVTGFNYIQWCGDVACTFFEPSFLGAPTGALTTWDKKFNWTGVIGAVYYKVEVQTATGTPVAWDWFSASTYCTGLTCQLPSPWSLPNGDYRWRVQDYSPAYGYGAITPWQYFTLNISIVVPGSPVGTLTSWDRSFNWTGLAGSTHYLVEVQTSVGDPVASDWFPASVYCTGTTCSLKPGWNLANGAYRWRSRDYGPTGYGLYTDWQYFTLNVPVVTLGSPVGALTSWDRSFNWTGISGSTYYQVEVQTSTGTPVAWDWFSASTNCTGTTCRVTSPWFLANGDYRWRIRDYSPIYGYGSYTGWQYFTLDLPIVTLGTPSGTLTSWDKSFNLTGIPGATYYQVEVQTSAGIPVNSDWFSASTYCSGTTCSIRPGWNLPNGDYRWRSRDYNPTSGYGFYTSWQPFTLNISVVVLGSPSGTLTSWDKSFHWTGISGVTYYQIEIRTATGTLVFSDWFSASTYCSGTTCNATLSGLSLANGDYRWRIRDYSPVYGYGSYTAPQYFTLSLP